MEERKYDRGFMFLIVLINSTQTELIKGSFIPITFWINIQKHTRADTQTASEYSARIII